MIVITKSTRVVNTVTPPLPQAGLSAGGAAEGMYAERICHSAIVSIPVASRQDTLAAGVRTPNT